MSGLQRNVKEVADHMDKLQDKIKALEEALKHCLEHGMDRKAYVLIEQALKDTNNS